jgi:hypothetical protein
MVQPEQPLVHSLVPQQLPKSESLAGQVKLVRKKKMRFYVIENEDWRRRCKMNNIETHLQFVALK